MKIPQLVLNVCVVFGVAGVPWLEGGADTLAVQIQPPAAGVEMVKAGGRHYAMDNLEAWFEADRRNLRGGLGHELGRFYMLGPTQAVTCAFRTPVDGTWNIGLRLVRHGNSFPALKVSVDGQSLGIVKHRGWRVLPPVELKAGRHTLRLEEASGEKDRGWPYALAGVDMLCITDDPSYAPPERMAGDPLDPEALPRFERPVEDVARLVLTSGRQSIELVSDAGGWRPGDLVLLDAHGAVQATRPFTVTDTTWGGWRGDEATIDPPVRAACRTLSNVEAASAAPVRFSPNNDGICDDVTYAAPGLTGRVWVTDFQQRPVRTLPEGVRVWNGLDDRGRPASTHAYLLWGETTGGTRVAAAYCDAEAPPALVAAPSVFSPNNDGLFDSVEAFLTNGLSWRPGEQGGVMDADGQQVLRLLPPGPTLLWDGRLASGETAPEGVYGLAVLDPDLRPRAMTRVRLIDRAPVSDAPWTPDVFPRGVWYLRKRPLDAVCADIRAHGGNMLFGVLATTSAVRELDVAWSNGVRVMVDLMPLVYGPAIRGAAQPPNEIQLETLLRPVVEALSGHPALLAYYLADEPRWSEDWALRLRAVQQVLARLDPEHPAIFVLVGLDDRLRFIDAVKPKALFIDVYPKNDYDDDWGTQEPGNYTNIYSLKNTTMLGYIDRYRERLGERNAPVWVILQAHRFSELDEPLPTEIGLQAWLSLTRGVRGVMFFAYETDQMWNGLVGPAPAYAESDRWRAAKPLFERLARLEPLLLKWRPADPVAVVTGGGNPYGYPHGESATMTDGTDTYLLLVNRDAEHARDMIPRSTRFPSADLEDVENGETFSMGMPVKLSPGDGRILRIRNPGP